MMHGRDDPAGRAAWGFAPGWDYAVTSDRARKKAARAQQAATGEPYTRARRSVLRQPSAQAEPVEPPPIDPRDRASYSHQWGDQACYLVLDQGRYYTWITDAAEDGRSVVHRVPSEDTGRAQVDEWQALNIIRAAFGDNARLGDALRGRREQLGDGRHLSPVLAPAGLHRSGLGPVLDGREFTWPTGPVVRPPGSRRPDTPVTTLAEYTIQGQQFTLECYQDSAGAHCVAIAHGDHPSVVKDVPVDEERLVNQGSLLVSRGGPGVIYGRAHGSVTALYSLGTDGERTNWPIYDDARTGERYFAVVVNPQKLADIVAEAPTASRSLKAYFDLWFNPPPRD